MLTCYRGFGSIYTIKHIIVAATCRACDHKHIYVNSKSDTLVTCLVTINSMPLTLRCIHKEKLACRLPIFRHLLAICIVCYWNVATSYVFDYALALGNILPYVTIRKLKTFWTFHFLCSIVSCPDCCPPQKRANALPQSCYACMTSK